MKNHYALSGIAFHLAIKLKRFSVEESKRAVLGLRATHVILDMSGKNLPSLDFLMMNLMRKLASIPPFPLLTVSVLQLHSQALLHYLMLLGFRVTWILVTLLLQCQTRQGRPFDPYHVEPVGQFHSPAPWDLLAWAEDHGRVCVIDLRIAFHSRQKIDLKVDSLNLERADVHDQESISGQRQLGIESRFAERHREALEAQNHLTAVNHAVAAERRRLDREFAISQDSLRSFTPRKRQIIDSTGSRRLQGSHPESKNNFCGPSKRKLHVK